MEPQINVAILIYNGVELVDMNGPVDVFYHANGYNNNRYNIYTVAATAGVIKSEGNIVTITPQYTIADCPEPDIIVIPGVLDHEVDTSMITWLTEKGKLKNTIMSVCIGAFTLAKTGLLNGRKGTTHYLSINDLHQQYPEIEIVKNVRFVDGDAEGHIVSTAGVTSGIDGALHLIELRDGAVIAQQVADLMVYNRDNPLPPFTILPPYFNMP